MIRQAVILIIVAIVTACSSTPVTNYYQLDTPQILTKKAVTSSFINQRHALRVAPVIVSDYLSGSGLVYQTDKVKYTIAANNQWASSLDQQLQQTLITHLTRDLPNWLITNQAVAGEQASLTVNVTSFHGRYDGYAVIKGTWLYQYQDQVIQQPFDLTFALKQDGYDALVQSLSEGWATTAEQIATRITH